MKRNNYKKKPITCIICNHSSHKEIECGYLNIILESTVSKFIPDYQKTIINKNQRWSSI